LKKNGKGKGKSKANAFDAPTYLMTAGSVVLGVCVCVVVGGGGDKRLQSSMLFGCKIAQLA
jgi:hypothetical protein